MNGDHALRALVKNWRRFKGKSGDDYFDGQCWMANKCADELEQALAGIEATPYQQGQSLMRERIADVLRGEHPELAALVEQLPLHGLDVAVDAALDEALRVTKPMRDEELEAERVTSEVMNMRLRGQSHD